jgi:SAM-dependent methyltransferase
VTKKIYFDEKVAASYDDFSRDMFAPEVIASAVDFLAELAGDGAVLEFAIGTGRIALPLAERGVDVHGIDLSPAMVDRLRTKPGGDAIDVTVGDFATTRVDGPFQLVYLVYNTITNLTTQDEQVECFVNAAAHLERGGRFVIEVGVPDLRRLTPGQTAVVFSHNFPTYVGVDEYTDMGAQISYSHHWWAVGDKLEIFSAPYRYVWPSELDLMARIAGMTLRERWSGWKREPFTNDSTSHVSVWEKSS